MFPKLSRLFNRSPATGDRKDPPMPDPTPQPPAQTPDVTAHLTALTDAVRQLAESQKALIESVKPPQTSPAPTPPPPTDIGGDPTGGASPSTLAAVDYSKLSPLQQITLGLRQGAD